MTESLQEQIAALAEMVSHLEAHRLPGAAIGDRAGLEAQDTDRLRIVEFERRWSDLDRHMPPVEGSRVLVMGEDAVDDASAFAARGAEHVGVLGPPGGAPAPSVNGSSAQVHWLARDSLRSETVGRYDLVHCGQLLHRSADPVGLLRALHRVIGPMGTLLLSTTMLSDPERSEYLRFVPGDDHRDGGSWFIPGRLAVRWMLQTAGFEVQDEFGERAGPREQVPVICAYLRAGVTAGTSAANSQPAVERPGDGVAARSAGADGHLPSPGS